MEPELHVDGVARAAERLTGIVNITPELTSRTLDERFDAHLRMKAECFQRTGSFKFRGAYNAIASLSPDEMARGVVTDEEIVAAMRPAFQRLNVVVEPSGASALAAVLSGAVDVTGQRVCITLSGGNFDLDRFRALTV